MPARKRPASINTTNGIAITSWQDSRILSRNVTVIVRQLLALCGMHGAQVVNRCDLSAVQGSARVFAGSSVPP